MPRPSKRKVKGSADHTARELFALAGSGKQNGKRMEAVEDREHMAMVLAHSPDPRVQRLVGALTTSEPLSARTSLATLAEQCGLNFHMISDEYTRIRKSEGYIRAAQHIPDIMEQTAIRAKERLSDCPVCAGMGKVDGKGGVSDCTNCKGTGNIMLHADSDELTLIFNTFGLTGKGGGVNVNLDLRDTTKHEDLGDLAGTLDGIIAGDK